MFPEPKLSLWHRIRTILLGRALNPHDQTIFHKISLIPFFAWVGLGADGLSSSCYGPEEAFKALQGHTYLAIFVGLASAVTIFVISAGYSQIIELFPTGGGGYIVATQLLSPTLGMLSGCALLIDYILTITLSIASGADAIFSFLPPQWLTLKLETAVLGVILLTVLNLRGVKESVLTLLPIFMVFVFTHIFAIFFALIAHGSNVSEVVVRTGADIHNTHAEVGFLGMIFLLSRAYSMGAGTYTGIEAVSNGLPILREPRVHNGKRTMTYMSVSLSFMVVGLMLAYLLYQVEPQTGKTLNAVLFGKLTSTWNSNTAYLFILITLISEAAILFVGAQAGFVDGPRVLANMSLDRWFPTKFAMLSDRLVTQNGIALMGGTALVLMILTHGSVQFLVVLYSINVFITFVLSQTGMVRHWWSVRRENKEWKKKFLVNGLGLMLTSFILVTVTIVKFYEGGWITLVVTGSLIAAALVIHNKYKRTFKTLRTLDGLVQDAQSAPPATISPAPMGDPQAKTAVLLVSGFNGLGLHALYAIQRTFEGIFKNYVFVQVGVVDAGNFKGTSEIDKVQKYVNNSIERYVAFMQRRGFYAEGFTSVGIDIAEEVTKLTPRILERFPHSVFFGGQIVLPDDSFLDRLMHNYITFTVQRRFYREGIPFIILPIRI